jgi:hypothetical protein
MFANHAREVLASCDTGVAIFRTMILQVSQVPPPAEPNASDSFESLRAAVLRHVQLARHYARALPDSHVDLVQRIAAEAAAARATLISLGADGSATAADIDRLERRIREQRDVERAYAELLAALLADCGGQCAGGQG